MPASARAILGPDAERRSATQALPPLTWAVRDDHHDRPVLAHQIELAAKIPHGIEELSRRIDALFRGLEQARAATRSPEKALEIAARQLGLSHRARRPRAAPRLRFRSGTVGGTGLSVGRGLSR